MVNTNPFNNKKYITGNNGQTYVNHSSNRGLMEAGSEDRKDSFTFTYNADKDVIFDLKNWKQSPAQKSVIVNPRFSLELEGNTKSEADLKKDKISITESAKAIEESSTSIGIQKEEKDERGNETKEKLEAGLQANAELEATGRLNVSKDDLDIGFRLSANTELGSYESFSKTTKTKAGSGFDVTLKLEQGLEAGGVVGSGLKVNKEGIHADLELDGEFAIFGLEAHLGVDLKYKDVKDAVNNIESAIICGPAGIATEYVIGEIEKDVTSIKKEAKTIGNAISEDVTEVEEKIKELVHQK